MNSNGYRSTWIGVLSLWAGLAAAHADPVADFYAKTQMHYIVGNGAGGGYDRYLRTLARHMARHIPGHPAYIVENMPGAGGIRATAYIYNVAPRDGSIVGMVTIASATEPLFGNTKADYATDKFTWIGNMDESNPVCLTSSTSGVMRFEDVMTKEAVFGATGAGGATVQHVEGLINLLGARIKLVPGYKGMADMQLALQRGEIQAYCGLPFSEVKIRYTADYTSGKLKVLIQTAPEKSTDILNVPDVFDFAKTEADRQVIDLVFARQFLGRPVLAPPDMPADRRNALRAAFDATVKDPEFIADAEKQKLTIATLPGTTVETIIRRYASYPSSAIAKAKKAMDGAM